MSYGIFNRLECRLVLTSSPDVMASLIRSDDAAIAAEIDTACCTNVDVVEFAIAPWTSFTFVIRVMLPGGKYTEALRRA